jgi:large subunit ribosomal protein L10
MARPEKEAAVKEIADKLSGAQAALLTEYRGLTVGQMADVRNSLRAADADYKVYKNTLARIAVKDVGLDELVERLQGPTAIAFCSGDAVAAAKALDEAARKYPVLEVKGGVLSGRVLGADQARDLARIEPREVQLAKIATMANSPVQGTANVLSALLRDLGSMLVQLAGNRDAGGGDGASDGAKEEAE